MEKREAPTRARVSWEEVKPPSRRQSVSSNGRRRSATIAEVGAVAQFLDSERKESESTGRRRSWTCVEAEAEAARIAEFAKHVESDGEGSEASEEEAHKYLESEPGERRIRNAGSGSHHDLEKWSNEHARRNQHRPALTVSSLGSRSTEKQDIRRSVLLPRSEAGGVRERITGKRASCVLAKVGSKAFSDLEDLIAGHSSPRSDSSGFSDDSHEVDEDDAHAGGLLVDYVIRKGGKAKMFDSFEQRHWKSLEYTKDAVGRDELGATLWEDIIEYYKHNTVGPQGQIVKATWGKTSPSAFRDRARSILDHTRRVKLLQAELHNWMLRYALLHSHVREAPETVHERRNRMTEFWTQYGSFSKSEALPPLQAVFDKVANRKQKMPGPVLGFQVHNADRQWKEIELIESYEHEGIQSKNLKEHVKRGMRFDPGGVLSLKWEVMEPAIGTRAALILQNSLAKRRRPGFLRGDIDGRELHKSRSVTSAYCGNIRATSAQRRKQRESIDLDDEEKCLSDEPTERYLQACRRCGIRPTPLPFVTGHSSKLQAGGKGISDGDLRPIIAMLRHVNSIEEVDLSDNERLTEKTLVPFLERLVGEPAASTLQVLSLKSCVRIGPTALNTIGRLLSEGDGLRNLTSLDLSRIKIDTKTYIKLSKAICKHGHLESLNLANTDFGNNPSATKECIGHILSSHSLRSLDVGWNCFDNEVFLALGQLVVNKKRIRSLSVSNCSAASNDNLPPPITFFLECLSHDEKLTRLDVSLNRMDFRAALVLEDNLAKHKNLQNLDISNNPLGVLGMRSALRLLSLDSSGLIFFDCTGSCNGSEIGAVTFNMTNPGCRYDLDLALPYHRTILRMLYKSCERLGHAPDQFFSQITYPKKWAHCSKDSRGNFEVPTSEKFSCTFSIEVAIETSVKVQPYDFKGFLEHHADAMKTKPGFHKVIPLFACWKRLDGLTFEQNVILDALGKDFALNPAYLEVFVSSCKCLKSETIHQLLPCISGGEASLAMCVLLFPSVAEFIRMHKLLRTYLDFNVQNPTGHYRLQLESCTDYAIAESLMLLDRWEVVLDKKSNRQDTSQRGNRSHLRNERYRGVPLYRQFRSLAEWKLPEVDVLDIDFISGKRCPADAVVVCDKTFSNLLVSLHDGECSFESKLQVLRKISHHVYLTSKQMRSLLGSFKSEADRAEAFVAFFLQIVDMWNAKIFRVRFSSDTEIRKLQERLGFATFFPFIQPENENFELDLQFHDQRICLSLLIKLLYQENTGNIRNPKLVRPDGTVDPLRSGVPPAWSHFDHMPKDALFSCTYVCAPELRKFSTRSNLSQTFGNFYVGAKETEVMWWTGLEEVPTDVLSFVEFIVNSKYKNVWRAFKAIDGPDGNGEIARNEFRAGMTKMRCTKFASDDEKEELLRIDNLFNYLDPGGEGTVSKGEWSILEQLWKEIKLSLSDFVEFLVRTFGELDDAWSFIDDDGSGELDLPEWIKAVEDLGYFGPAEIIFGVLDHSKDGNISWEEFTVLKEYT